MGPSEGTAIPPRGPAGRRPGASPGPAGSRPDLGKSNLVPLGTMEPLAQAIRPEAARVLVCDHRGNGLERALSALPEAGIDVEVTTTLRSSLRRLEQAPPDAILLDPLSRQGSVELAALDSIRSGESEGPAVPVLLVADPEDDDAAARADQVLAHGSWDLVPRGARPHEIARRLHRLIEERRLALEMSELRHRALHDDRTDLLRPQAFQKRLDEHFSAAKRHEHDLAFVLIDLDRFGAINKVHDHTVGDDLIARVGEVIHKALRVEDSAGRLGGDEFAVILPFTGKRDAMHVVNRLRVAIRELSGRPRGAKAHIEVSASIGVETYDGADLQDVAELREHAERALRVSKEKGGDKATYYRTLTD